MKHILRNKGDISDIRHAYDEGAQHAATQDVRRPVLHQTIFPEQPLQASPAASLVSTIASRADLDIEPSPIERRGDATPATPQDFSALFPSNRQLLIGHDYTEGDGFMNLRVDTEVGSRLMTLYHLRMQNLHDREFSLRRYCRDSGREVCHTTRSSSMLHRPGLQRSLSHVLKGMRAQSSGSLRRNDSGYGSMHSSDDRPRTAHGDPNIIRLDFSNYAQVDVRHSGTTRYEFDYWGKEYIWRIESNGFELYSGDHSLAYIIPRKSLNENDWILPSIMAITDPEILESQKDLSDVIVAAGLVALVDYSLRSLNEISRTPKIKFIGPRRLLQMLRQRSTPVSPQQPPMNRAWSA